MTSTRSRRRHTGDGPSIVRRWLRRSVIGVVVVALFATTSACASENPKKLPGSERIVSSDNPLTAEQAASVRADARALALDIVRLLPAEDTDIDGTRSQERWSDCTAKQKFGFHPTMNGVLYAAFLRVDRDTLTTGEIKQRLEGTGIRWKAGNDLVGEIGVFDVRLGSQRQPIWIKVTSPCYFFDDVDGISPDEKTKITGFISRKWDE